MIRINFLIISFVFPNVAKYFYSDIFIKSYKYDI